MKRRPNWPSIQAAYQRGGCSLPELSRRFGVPLSTLQKRCCRERWRDQMQRLGNAVEASAMAEATQLGLDMARRAEAFVERCLADDQLFHARIMAALQRAEAGDVQAIRSLIAAWRDLLTMTRAAYKLDEPAPAAPRISFTKVNIGCSCEPAGTVIDYPSSAFPGSCTADESPP